MWGASVNADLFARTAAAGLGVCLVGACSGDPKPEHEGAWEFKIDTVAGAAPAAWLRGTGKEGPQGKPQAVAAILSFDCRSDHSGATVMTEQALRQGTADIALALDGQGSRPMAGFAGTTPTGGQVVMTAPLDSVLGLMRGRAEVTIDYADGAGSSKTTAVFPLQGLETFRERFLAACGDRVRESK